MTESIELQGEDEAVDDKRKRKRFVWFMIPAVVLVGGIGIWVTWPDADEFTDVPEDLEEIAAATAPPIIPPSNESRIDVPAAFAEERPVPPQPTYIAPAIPDTPSPATKSLDVPIADPFLTTPYDEHRSRLQDALNASMVVEVKEIVDERVDDEI